MRRPKSWSPLVVLDHEDRADRRVATRVGTDVNILEVPSGGHGLVDGVGEVRDSCRRVADEVGLDRDVGYLDFEDAVRVDPDHREGHVVGACVIRVEHPGV